MTEDLQQDHGVEAGLERKEVLAVGLRVLAVAMVVGVGHLMVPCTAFSCIAKGLNLPIVTRAHAPRQVTRAWIVLVGPDRTCRTTAHGLSN